MMDIDESGNAIQIGLAMRGWSQRDLAEAAGLTPWRIWKFENNRDTPCLEELAAILSACPPVCN
jgi:transcriptional regulator with XRE-family HTH domain